MTFSSEFLSKMSPSSRTVIDSVSRDKHSLQLLHPLHTNPSPPHRSQMNHGKTTCLMGGLQSYITSARRLPFFLCQTRMERACCLNQTMALYVLQTERIAYWVFTLLRKKMEFYCLAHSHRLQIFAEKIKDELTALIYPSAFHLLTCYPCIRSMPRMTEGQKAPCPYEGIRNQAVLGSWSLRLEVWGGMQWWKDSVWSESSETIALHFHLLAE